MDKEVEKLIYNVENCFVKTRRVQDMFTYIDDCRKQQKFSKSNGKHNFLMVGAPGAGKTQIIEQYCALENNVPYTETIGDRARVTIMPILNVIVPHSYTNKEFYEEILRAMGLIPYQTSKESIARDKVYTMLDKLKVEVLFLDEVQSIIYARGVHPITGLEALKELSNKTRTLIIGCGVPNATKIVKLDPQYFSRFEVVQLKTFERMDEEFIEFLKGIVNQIDAPFYLGFDDLNTNKPESLFKLSNGNPRELMKIIRAIFREGGLYRANKLSDINITTETFLNVRLNMLNNQNEATRKEMFEHMNEVSENMINEKLKLFEPKKDKNDNRKKENLI